MPCFLNLYKNIHLFNIVIINLVNFYTLLLLLYTKITKQVLNFVYRKPKNVSTIFEDIILLIKIIMYVPIFLSIKTHVHDYN